MKLEYTIDKSKRLITLTLLKDICESSKILHYIERELSLENGRYSMNERILFLETCEEYSETEKNVLNIKWLNGDEGLSEVLNIICTYLGTNIITPQLYTVIEGVVDFDIPYKQRFDMIIAASLLEKSKKNSEPLSSQDKKKIAVSEQLGDPLTFYVEKTGSPFREKNETEESTGLELTQTANGSSVCLGEGLTVAKEYELSLQPQESPNIGKFFIPEQPSEFGLTAFRETNKKPHKRRKSSPEFSKSAVNIREP
jgi:hypothetical protein